MIRGEIVCGRRFCIGCRRWRLVMEFAVNRHWPDGSPRYLFSRCKTCDRLRKREAHGYQPKRWVSEEEKARCIREYAEVRLRRRREDARWAEERREYERIYKDMQRRRDGIPERQFRNRGPRAPDLEPARRLVAVPFSAWLREREGEYDDRVHMARALGMDDSLLGKLLEDRKPAVSIDTVEHALVREGSTFLWQLYPDLYPELVPPAAQEAA